MKKLSVIGCHRPHLSGGKAKGKRGKAKGKNTQPHSALKLCWEGHFCLLIFISLHNRYMHRLAERTEPHFLIEPLRLVIERDGHIRFHYTRKTPTIKEDS